MSRQNFRSFLVSISERLKDDDLRKLKFLCEDEIPAGKLSRIKEPIDLFDALIGKGKLAKHDTSLLENLLKDVGHDALCQKVQEYNAQGRFNSTISE